MANQALDEDTQDGAEEPTSIDGDPTAEAAPGKKPLSFTRAMNARAAVAWVRDKHGDEGVRMLASSLPPEIVRELGGPLLKPVGMTWIPFSAQARLLEHIDAIFGAGDLRLLVDVGRGMARHDFPSLARPLASLISPGLFLDMATKIWRLYNSHGKWEIVRGERDVIAVLLGCPEAHPAFCRGVCGWCEGAMLFSGAVDVEAREERCVSRGAPCCSFRVTWREKKDGVRDRVPRPPS